MGVLFFFPSAGLNNLKTNNMIPHLFISSCHIIHLVAASSVVYVPAFIQSYFS